MKHELQQWDLLHKRPVSGGEISFRLYSCLILLPLGHAAAQHRSADTDPPRLDHHRLVSLGPQVSAKLPNQAFLIFLPERGVASVQTKHRVQG